MAGSGLCSNGKMLWNGFSKGGGDSLFKVLNGVSVLRLAAA